MITEDEMRILMELRRAGREKMTVIAKKLGIPLSTVYDKKRRLEKKLIRRYVALTEESLVKAWLIIEKSDKNREELMESNCINNLYNANRNFLAEVICRDFEELENLKEKLNAKEHLVISEIKKEDFWTRNEHLELVKTGNPPVHLKTN